GGEVWMALNNNLLHFDKAGNRLATYKIYAPGGARLEAKTILVQKDQLIIGSDPLGLYLFSGPDKKNRKGMEFSSACARRPGERFLPGKDFPEQCCEK